MAKLKNPLLSLRASGSLSRVITFVRRRGVDLVEKKPEIIDVKSAGQLGWRHMFNKCVDLWYTLSAAEKQEWESAARPRHMTGYAWYISQCLRPNPGIYLPLQGGTMTGDIDMAKHRILKLPAPTDSQEAARKAEVDAVTGETSWHRYRVPAAWHFSHPQHSNVTHTPDPNELWAVPFHTPVAVVVTAIGFTSAFGNPGLARLGIYQDNGSIYPGALVSDCGTVDVTVAGSKSISGLNINFAANTLYWLVYLANALVNIYYLVGGSAWCLLGAPNPHPVQSRGSYFRAFAFAPLPDPFPAAASLTFDNKPGIGVYL